MLPRRTLIAVRHVSLRDQLIGLAADLPWSRSRCLSVVVLAGETQREVCALRAAEGETPLGVIAEDEPNVLAALSGGADDAVVLPALDPAAFTAFVDRVELRAQLRLEKEQLQVNVARSEKLLALGTLVAGVAHEINNPLSAVLLSTQIAAQQLVPVLALAREIGVEVREGRQPSEGALERLSRLVEIGRAARDPARVFAEISSAADAIGSIVRDLRVFAPTEQEEPAELFEVDELLDRAVRLVGRDALVRGVIERDYGEHDTQLFLPRGRIMQVVVNLLVNAIHAIREVERPVHRIRISTRRDEDFVAIAISDTGPGIAPGALERIFDPFFSSKRQGMETGLGLSLSRSILRRLGGELSVESVYGDGATFLCFLPIATPRLRAKGSVRPVHTDGDRTRSSCVLLIDDDGRVRTSYARLLDAEHRVLTAQDGHDAIELLESGSIPDVVVLELDLPVVSGATVVGWLRANRPELGKRTIIVTRAASNPAYAEFLSSYTGQILHKPVRVDDLMAAIDAACAQPRLSDSADRCWLSESRVSVTRASPARSEAVVPRPMARRS